MIYYFRIVKIWKFIYIDKLFLEKLFFIYCILYCFLVYLCSVNYDRRTIKSMKESEVVCPLKGKLF